MSPTRLWSPLLIVALAAVWVLLVNDLSPGTIVFGLLLGATIAALTNAYWPERPLIRNPRAIAGFVLVVLYDIVVANLQVAYLVLFRRGDSLRSQFVAVPLNLKKPEAIALLAGTITMTPGTVSADVSADSRALLVHCLDTGDPNAVVADIKSRYEARLMRIFE